MEVPVSVARLLVGLLCSAGGLGLATWLTAVCLLAPSAHALALSAWPLAGVAALSALGGWTFPGAWWVIALFAGFPSLLFTAGWFLVIADEGQRNPSWPGLGAVALAGAQLVSFAASRWQLARLRRRAAPGAA
jgi:hypothetical protein